MNAQDYYWTVQVKTGFTLADRLAEPEYSNMWFPMKEAHHDIDSSIGRNKMITYLKIKGILDFGGKPILGNKDFDFFRVESLKKVKSFKAQYYNFKIYYITTQGILEIRKMINDSRLAGANI